MAIIVRPARPEDAATLCQFNACLAEESEDKKLDAATLRAGVAALLDDPHKGTYFVAERDGGVVGQLAVTFEWSDWRNGWFWWIQSVYVHKDARRGGVFRALFEHVQNAARADGQVIGIRLYVENENNVAHAVYEDLGFEWTNYRVMEKCPI